MGKLDYMIVVFFCFDQLSKELSNKMFYIRTFQWYSHLVAEYRIVHLASWILILYIVEDAHWAIPY